MRVTPATILPDLGLVGSPADPVQQSSFGGRMIRDARGDAGSQPQDRLDLLNRLN